MKTAVHQYEDKLLEFAYGELPQHEADAVDAHVRGCARCSQALGEIRGVRATMAKLPAEPAPDAGLESLLAYAEQAAARTQQSQRAAAPFWRRFLVPLGTVMALATVGVVALRANERFDTSKAEALADQQLADRRAQTEAAPEPAAPPPPPPAAQAAAPALDEARENAQQPEKPAENKVALAKDKALTDNGILGGRGGNAEDDSLRRDTAASTKASTSRRKAAPVTKAPSKLEPAADYSNSGATLLKQEASRSEESVLAKKDAPAAGEVAENTPAPAQPAPRPTGAPGTWGLGGSASTATPSAAPPAEEKASAAKEAAPQREAPAAAPKSAAKPAGTEGKKSKKGSFELSPLSSSTRGAEGGPADQDLGDSTDAKYYDDQAKFAERQRAEAGTVAIGEGRSAAKKGDLAGEILAYERALKAGVTGSQRLEALDGLCRSLEATGQFARADAYCDALESEFPSSSAAVASRRRKNATQKSRAADEERNVPAQAPAPSSTTY